NACPGAGNLAARRARPPTAAEAAAPQTRPTTRHGLPMRAGNALRGLALTAEDEALNCDRLRIGRGAL
ncbi:MAG: hypothetical protein AAF646_18405, partial [Pseudomonadota bacterium]